MPSARSSGVCPVASELARAGVGDAVAGVGDNDAWARVGVT